jgi:hypothetical protein
MLRKGRQHVTERRSNCFCWNLCSIYGVQQWQGIILLTVSSAARQAASEEEASLLQHGFLFLSLATISLGSGGIKPNVRCKLLPLG